MKIIRIKLLGLLIYIITGTVFIVFMSGCSSTEDFHFKTGDLLFRGENLSGLSGAIDDVTQTGDDNHFSHVGLVQVIDGEVNVIHAEGVLGVCIQPLDSFMYDKNGDRFYVEAFRLKHGSNDIVSRAVSLASSAIGEPYNFSYIIDDEGYYCSELVWWAFAPDSVFVLEPMTFKNHPGGSFHPVWETHYNDLGIAIPEGKPGCNPNGLAASDKIYRLGVVD